MNIRVDLLLERIGKKIEARRKEAELTQATLAERAGISRVSVTNIEAGKQHISLPTLLALADALDVDLRELLPSRKELTSDVRVIMASTDSMISGKTEVVLDELLRGTTKRSEDPSRN